MAAHARLGASSAHRWAYCAGSVAAEEGYPRSSSAAADAGTAMHELAELALSADAHPSAWLGKVLPENNAFTVTQEMVDLVSVYVDYVRSLGGLQFFEQRVELTDWIPESFGTADAIVLVGSVLYVVDLKTGHQRVDAFENLQGILYALGALSDFELTHPVSDVVVVIVQPRLDSISEWSVPVGDLLGWGSWLGVRARLAMEPNAKRTPGEKQCHWCRAKARCPALLEMTEQLALLDFDVVGSALDLPPVDDLPDERLRQVLDARKLIVGWLDAVEALVSERLENGEGFPGYKLVEGRSSRAWLNEAEAAVVLVGALGEDAAYKKSLLSPAQAEAAVGKTRKAELAPLIAKTQGKPSLAPESDPRPGVGLVAGDFEVEK